MAKNNEGVDQLGDERDTVAAALTLLAATVEALKKERDEARAELVENEGVIRVWRRRTERAVALLQDGRPALQWVAGDESLSDSDAYVDLLTRIDAFLDGAGR